LINETENGEKSLPHRNSIEHLLGVLDNLIMPELRLDMPGGAEEEVGGIRDGYHPWTCARDPGSAIDVHVLTNFLTMPSHRSHAPT
jgi:hypothetical protein